MKLSQLQKGDKFSFAKAKRKPQGKVYVVEGQYPLKKITTVFSEEFLLSHKETEPIAVNNGHEVNLIAKGAYAITHKIQALTKNSYAKKQDRWKIIQITGYVDDPHESIFREGTFQQCYNTLTNVAKERGLKITKSKTEKGYYIDNSDYGSELRDDYILKQA